MRRDPIIKEDWKVGSTEYFSFKYYSWFDFILSLMIIIVGVVTTIISETYFYLFLWTFSIPVLILIEIFLDQEERTIANRMIVFASLTFLSYLTIFPIFGLLRVINAILLGLKFINAPLQNFILEYYEDILIPNNENVELVLNEHLARLQESDYQVETNEEFQKRIFTISKRIISVLGMSLLMSIILFYFLSGENQVGNYIRLGILAITALSFTYTTVAWYLDQRFDLRQRKKDQDIGDEAIFPEMME